MMLEQELEKYLSGQTLCNCDSVSYRNIKNLILGFAEPIEKRIAELEESNKEWQRTCEAKSDTNSQLVEQLADKVEKIATLERNVAYYAERAKHAELDGRDIVLENKSLGERCLQLQKDKGNLTDSVRDLEEKLANADYQLEGRDLEIKELEAQLEQEKNLSQCMSDHNEQLRELIEQMKCCYNCKH